MNIHKAWKKGLTGKGVTICVNDPAGVDKNHDDLASKFVSSIFYCQFMIHLSIAFISTLSFDVINI